MNKTEFKIRMAGLTLRETAKAILHQPLYCQRDASGLLLLQQAAEETSYTLRVVAKEGETLTIPRRHTFLVRGFDRRILVGNSQVLVAIHRKVLDPWENSFWGRVIELKKEAARQP